MRKSRRRHRALRAALGLAIILALGFAADAIVLMTTRAHADAADSPEDRREQPAVDRNSAQASGDRSQAAVMRIRGRSSTIPGPRERRFSAAWPKDLARAARIRGRSG